MAESTQSTTMARVNGFMGLLIGLFGALAILGVTAKIQKWDSLLGFDYNTVITVGFVGEAAAFIIMGLLALMQGMMAKSVAPKLAAAQGSTAVYSPEEAKKLQAEIRQLAKAEVQRIFGTMGEDYKQMNAEVREALVSAVQSGISSDLSQLTAGLGQVMGALGEEVQRFGSEMRGMGQEMHQARASVAQMRETLSKTATGSLPQDAQRLGEGMSSLSEEMSAAGHQAEAIRSELEQVARRFQLFNNPGSSTNGKARSHAEQYVSRA